MANIVARIRLAPGETGYYDEKTDIYLNWLHPEADVKAGLDYSNLRRSVKYHRIVVVKGSLGTPKSFKQILMEAKSRRTGTPLEDLMGDTPLAQEPEVLDSEGDETKTAETITVDPATGTGNTESVPATETKTTDDTKTDEKTEEALSTTPKSFRNLKVGGTRDITANKPVTGAVSSDEAVATVSVKENVVTITGISAGSVTIQVTSENETVSVSGTVIEA